MPTTPYESHRQLWAGCRKCGLCEGRQNVVLARGRVPADVLFVGEAPGQSEDVLGRPFVGPAGRLLDQIIEGAWESVSLPEGQGGKFVATCAFTNLVACIPIGEDGDKVKEPESADIMSCQPRLEQFIKICKPKLIVCVGALSAKWLRKNSASYGVGDIKMVDLVHPAAILRSNIAQRGLAIQRAIVTLANAVEGLPEPV